MKLSHSAARIALVVHLERPESAAADIARMQHVVHLFRGHHVPATWSVADCCDLELMQHKGLLRSGDEIVVAISASEAAAPLLRDSLRKRVAALQACTGSTVGLVAGEPAILRNHAAILAEQGLRGIVSNALKRPNALTHSPLPCGLWQFDHALAVPHTSMISRLFGGSSLHRLQKLAAKEQTLLISVDAARISQASTRSLQNLESMLRHISHAASREEITITTTGELLAELTASRASRPQHSILRAA